MKQIKRVKLTVLLWLVILLLAACMVVENYPEPTDDFYVNDFAQVMDTEAEDHIRRVAEELEDVTTAQVVVVTMAGIDGDSLEEYTLELFRRWGIGQKEKDNGVLIFVDVEGR
ncbi:MAG: TPM domain-containing protein, partial [Clostridiales bacterium]|nr:TPM domain-containing protein [Clostridiales bacterium]